jgi:DNA-binding SARP family transcriptional activator
VLEVRLLGTFDVRFGGRPIAFSSRPAHSLFAYLILNAGLPHRREKLAALLWPDSPEETARGNLRHALWQVRKTLPRTPHTEFLMVDDISVAFNASSEYRLDVAILKTLTDDASTDMLELVLSEYRGEFLPGFYDEWVILERDFLESFYEHKMAHLISLLQKENRWLDVLEWGERWIFLGRKPEFAYRALMRAHAAKGDMAGVAMTYDRCLKSLTELSVVPSTETRMLYERLKKEGSKSGNGLNQESLTRL